MNAKTKRRSRCGTLAPGTLAMLAGTLLATAAALAQAPLHVGDRAPALVVPRLDGPVFDLAAERGKVVIVNLWATWCSPCRAEMPRLDAFYKRYHARGVELLGLSVDDAADRAAVAQIMKGFSYPAALEASARVNGFGPAIAVPTTWIIDSEGIVRARLMSGNAVTEQALEQAVLPLLPHGKAKAAQ